MESCSADMIYTPHRLFTTELFKYLFHHLKSKLPSSNSSSFVFPAQTNTLTPLTIPSPSPSSSTASHSIHVYAPVSYALSFSKCASDSQRHSIPFTVLCAVEGIKAGYIPHILIAYPEMLAEWRIGDN